MLLKLNFKFKLMLLHLSVKPTLYRYRSRLHAIGHGCFRERHGSGSDDLSIECFHLNIDDLSETVKTADRSLFADDGMLFVEGKYVSHRGKTARDIQTALNNVHPWCETWGFKLSSDKSVAVMFAQITPPTPLLLIDGRVVKFQKSARFLGLTFDRQLTYGGRI